MNFEPYFITHSANLKIIIRGTGFVCIQVFIVQQSTLNGRDSCSLATAVLSALVTATSNWPRPAALESVTAQCTVHTTSATRLVQSSNFSPLSSPRVWSCGLWSKLQPWSTLRRALNSLFETPAPCGTLKIPQCGSAGHYKFHRSETWTLLGGLAFADSLIR